MNSFNRFILFIILGLSVLSVAAQQKQFKVETPYTDFSIYPDRLAQLQWIPGTEKLSYVDDGRKSKTPAAVIEVDVKGKKETRLTLDVLAKDFKKYGFKEPKRFPQMKWVNAWELRFIKDDTLYEYNLKEHKIRNLTYYPQSSEVIKYEKNLNQTAYTRENNLYIYSNGKETAVTNHTDKNLVSGQTVSRSEYGITHGIFWSPKGNYLAFYTKDESEVSDYPLVNIDARVAELENIKYPMAGMSSEKVTLNVFNPQTGKTVTLNTGKVAYLTNITWSPDEKYIFIQVLNRATDHMWFNKYDAQSGEYVKTLFEEKNKRYVEPLDPVYFLNGSNTEFVYFSQRDGYHHAYLYNTDGKLLKQLTKGPWVITDFLGFDEDNRKMYFMATKDSPIERHLYVLDMKSGKMSKLTDTHGTHHIELDDDKQFFIDNFSNYTDVEREIRLYSTKGKKMLTLLENRNTLSDYKLGAMTIATLKADDGTPLYYRLIKPVDFDSTKKYPVIVYVYGGPHAQLVNDTWLGGGGFFLQALAARGYVVFTLDNRGSGNRGFAFESIIHRQLGVTEMKDQMVGVDFLRSLPYVDTARIGVDGWSFGGFMTTSLMTDHAETFKVGVAGGPVIDWKYYEVMYGERYMDTPEENPEGYEKTSLLNKVDKLQGRLMLIHGTMDPTVVWQHSLLFLQECVKHQKQVDYFVYPGHEHNVRGMDRLHLETKIARYFDDFL
jgi:dipeptidyl-peptidase-4